MPETLKLMWPLIAIGAAPFLPPLLAWFFGGLSDRVRDRMRLRAERPARRQQLHHAPAEQVGVPRPAG